jgi:cysteinyl-tRNA synthetase
VTRRTEGLGAGTDPASDVMDRFRARMDDDLNTGAAMAIVAETVTAINRALDIDDVASAEPLVAAFRSMLAAVGLELHGAAPARSVDSAAAALCRQRDDARAAKEWARADSIRNELVALGYVVEDTPGGTKIRK